MSESFSLLPLAASGVDSLIGFLVLAFWAFAQLARFIKKAGKNPSDYAPMSDEVKKIFEQMTGQAPQEIPGPPPLVPKTKRAKPVTQASRQQTTKQKSIVIEETRAPLRVELEQPLTPKTSPIKGMGFGMKSTALPMIGNAMSSSGTERHVNIHRPDLKSKEQIRKAILSQIILGPPKALERI